MKPPIFDYVAADSLEAALAALAAGPGEAKVLAGGQSLMPMLNFRLVRPARLVDINRVPGLAYVREEPDFIRVGALTRHYALETSPVIARHLPVLTAAMGHVAHLAIRNRGTIGGSLAHADPAAELPLMAVLLDAELTIRSARGTRVEAAGGFFQSALTTSLGADEILTEVAFPRPATHTGWGFEEVARRDGDYALAAAAATLHVESGRIVEARLALMGVGETPLRAHHAEALLTGEAAAPALLDEVAREVRTAIDPGNDLHASADYRRHLAGVLARRVVSVAWERALKGGS